ncbi:MULTISPECIES: flavin-containing monooxygenase [Bacillaceae]|uniref:Oxidoreductase n=1 Tax=Halalkalibacter akibai (strain ATCC 43226 / DSM 21942 / CIP 109018 / JCM 9157 / 1139) TaxID=1236973 RepID=W4QZD2_HALA3|nr:MULTISPECIES: NAD(P)/FAD-dependent oxidoreductase [Bacillaceae]MED4164493.1 NAD(P)/FAD-dependent oxidoreductase [Halalkalibacterium halodurans]GAE36674.1 hypothetical protein JCM9157_3882 [Halalkalibacter akibai JCM 9157]
MVYDVLVIGGGQAGLAVGYYLKKEQLQFLIIDEQERTGDSWRNRFDSLVLFTPRRYSALPGLALNGDPNGYPTKDEIADYLQDYADQFRLPISHNVKIQRLMKKESIFIVTMSNGKTYQAKQVIIATGAFHTPFTPSISHFVHPHIVQLHAVDYKNPKQIPTCEVLIVGAGNTGVQIAAELSNKCQVTLSSSKKMRFLPQQLFGKSIFWWFELIGIYKVKSDTLIGELLKKNDPIIGGNFKQLRKKVIIAKRLIDFKGNTASFINGKQANFDTIIWATGYQNDYSWVKVDEVISNQSKPIHQRGITSVKGLYFIGLSWQTKRGSALLQGVGEDAQYIVEKVKEVMRLKGQDNT